MTTLENLYHGNINPSESEILQDREDYKQSILLVTKAQEELKAALTDEQMELFGAYLMNAEELSLIVEEEMFKEGFKLAARIMTEISG
ncbi:MAG: hypothetical protein IJR70_05020 [Eubacterium sp.]|nr:hypothetical protein [Eubacterium sp.]